MPKTSHNEEKGRRVDRWLLHFRQTDCNSVIAEEDMCYWYRKLNSKVGKSAWLQLAVFDACPYICSD